ncbi:MAG: hypothetical protein Q8918_00185 [Bacteroidota bacterium]|nr:hypothetical protein [Bacteroidota bacterium]MDP4211906.1 hypothetical protein [Bacteroidota bacterium]MDP4248505.1 hypothetical protein [Bacteroidota bacterium]
MYSILNKYLFQHKSISIPGLGTICLETQPASLDSSTRTILPPVYYFRFDKYSDTPDKDFFSYLATIRQIPEYEAMRQYNEFAYALRDRINHLQKTVWEGVGELKKDQEGNIQFDSTLQNPFFLQPVSAEKLVRANAQHTLLVGDRERTSDEMSKWFSEEPVQGNRLWWLVALITGVAALLLIAIHFSSHGWNVESTGNQQAIHVNK